MKKMLGLLLFTSGLLLAQNNVALLHIEPAVVSTTSGAGAEFSETKFELAGGMIIVRASINGVEGDFILDTGAPGIVLNSRNEDMKSLCTASGVGGSLAIGEVELKNFQWGIIRKEKMWGYLLDVRHLEVACGRNIMGLIGFDVLKNYELLFDFPHKKIQAFKAGEAKVVRGDLKLTATIPFVLYGHVPVILAKVGDKRAFLGLDSGAEVNLLDQAFFDKIDLNYLSDVEEEFLTGLENSRQRVMAADVRTTVVKGENLEEMRYVFADLSLLREHFDAPLDGLLGFPFFKNQVVSINYQSKKICIWE